MNILIPIDGSPASLRALDYAISHYPEASFVLLNVQDFGGASELAHALPGLFHWGESPRSAGVHGLTPSDWSELMEQAAAKALKEATAKSEAANISFETFLRTGATAETIAEVAREKSVDHIVMGTRGLSRIQGLLLGSVAMKVIHLAEVPIMLVK
jgi:nucleotide-binding universal stress UspA family protein